MASRNGSAAPVAAVLHSIDELLQDETLLDQQRVFVQHMRNTAQPLHPLFEAVLHSEYEWLRIPLRDACATQVQTIVGYAKLLLERPEQFGATGIAQSHEGHLRRIHEGAVVAFNWLHALDGYLYHRQWSSAVPEAFGLDSVVVPLLMVLRYHLRDRAVLESTIVGAHQRIHANAYHASQVIQHIAFAIVRDLEGVRRIEVTLRQSPQAVLLDFRADGAVFDDQALSILFERQGSRHYRQRLAAQNADILPEGNTLRLSWPRFEAG